MKKMTWLTAALISLFFAEGIYAQTLLSTWLRNTTGKTSSYWASSGGMSPTFTFTTTTDSADVLRVAYNSSYVYVRSNGMTDSMGKYLNPGTCVAQGYTHKFPMSQTVPVAKTISPKVGQIGLLINGIPIYGLSNASSWNGTTNAMMGTGIWNVEVGKSEGFVLDATLGAHPQQQGAYHTHDKPYRLYKNTPATQHSPIIGFAFDGYPVYGPYGYSSATDANSAVIRMKSGYSLRNITTRTTLPYGVAASQTGPAVSTTYPLGTYCEDYEWLAANGGDLDKYNGRMCVTPEYPAGTYAYFVTIDAAGAAAFPYYIGIEYYGAPEASNFPHGPAGNGLTIPTTGVTEYTGGTLSVKIILFDGKQAGNTNILYWTLAQGEAPAKITLERSSDAEHFTEIATFNSPSANQFEYKDARPLNKNYYRLKVTSLLGQAIYSRLISLNNNNRSSVLVYPTATNSLLNVEGLATSTATLITVTDALGKIMLIKQPALGNAEALINVSALAKGAYFVSVKNGGFNEVYKIMKL